jgi:hypothetical protein
MWLYLIAIRVGITSGSGVLQGDKNLATRIARRVIGLGQLEQRADAICSQILDSVVRTCLRLGLGVFRAAPVELGQVWVSVILLSAAALCWSAAASRAAGDRECEHPWRWSTWLTTLRFCFRRPASFSFLLTALVASAGGSPLRAAQRSYALVPAAPAASLAGGGQVARDTLR